MKVILLMILVSSLLGIGFLGYAHAKMIGFHTSMHSDLFYLKQDDGSEDHRQLIEQFGERMGAAQQQIQSDHLVGIYVLAFVATLSLAGLIKGTRHPKVLGNSRDFQWQR